MFFWKHYSQLAVHVAYHLTLETAFLNDAIATYPEDAVQRLLSHSAETGSTTCTVDTPSRDKDKDPAEAVPSSFFRHCFFENSPNIFSVMQVSVSTA